jgi:hypothetical protein
MYNIRLRLLLNLQQPGLPQREVPLGKLSKSSLQEREPLQQLSKRELLQLSLLGNLQKRP